MKPIDSPETEPTKERRLLREIAKDALSIATPIIALTISLISLTISARVNRKTAMINSMRAEYADLYEITKLGINNPEQAHLFANPDDYQKVRRRVQQMNHQLTPELRQRLLMQERALANMIFTSFAETVDHYNLALRNGDDEVAEILRNTMSNYVDRILDNPRLCYYWSEKGGDLTIAIDPDAKQYYEPTFKKVLARGKDAVDPDGPYGDSHS